MPLRPNRTAVAVVVIAAITVVITPATAGSGLAASRFTTLGPGAPLPTDSTCASRVRPAPEVRPENALANATVPSPGSFTLAPMDAQVGYDNRTRALEARITGDFRGTTDELIQWAACKWGLDEDKVRAIAVNESWWYQSQLGDETTNPALCPPGYSPPCPRSFGILQVGVNGDPIGNFPLAKTSTAFNLDVALFNQRVCYEGYMWWLRNIGYSSYAAGDEWGCIGEWYSGGWHDAGAENYITRIKGFLAARDWADPDFSTAPVSVTTTTTAAPTTTVAASCPCLRYGFEDGTVQGWYRAWGAVTVTNTAPAQAGSRGLAVNLGPSGPDWPAVQLSSPPALAVAKLVTMWIYQPAGAVLTSVRPYVADLNWNDIFVPAVRLSTGWNKVTWTVPSVNGIKGIGILFNNDAGWTGQLIVDSIAW